MCAFLKNPTPNLFISTSESWDGKLRAFYHVNAELPSFIVLIKSVAPTWPIQSLLIVIDNTIVTDRFKLLLLGSVCFISHMNCHEFDMSN